MQSRSRSEFFGSQKVDKLWKMEELRALRESVCGAVTDLHISFCLRSVSNPCARAGSLSKWPLCQGVPLSCALWVGLFPHSLQEPKL